MNLIDIDPTTLQIISAVVIPFLISAVTKLGADARLKATLNIVFNGVGALLSTNVVDNGHAVISSTTLRDWVLGITTTIGAYYGVLKPLGADQKLLPTKGLGTVIDTTAEEVVIAEGD